MKIINPSFDILDRPSRDEALTKIERAGRTCYKSEDKITEDSASGFVKRIMNSGHHSVLEHVSASVKIVCSRAVSHEIVRHRLASYSQESQRYCNYSAKGGVEFVKPEWVRLLTGTFSDSIRVRNISRSNWVWFESMLGAEKIYNDLINFEGLKAEQAREVLPNSTKTEIIMTANIREWIHVFKLRCSQAAHPEMRRIMIPLRYDFRKWLPEVFEEVE